MRQARRRRKSRRHEVWALWFSRAGNHEWAIHEANELVALWRPGVDREPAAMARALAVRAVCLHVRGRLAEAEQDLDECRALRNQVTDPVARVGLLPVASFIERAGRGEEALALVEQLLAESRADPRPPALLLAYGRLLRRQGRVVAAIAVLREAEEPGPGRFPVRTDVAAELVDALAAAGRYAELELHLRRYLPVFAVVIWGSPRRRLLFIQILEWLDGLGVDPGPPPLAVIIAKQRKKLARQQRWRSAPGLVFGALTGRRRDPPEPPPASSPEPDPDPDPVLRSEADVEIAIQRYQEAGDFRRLSEAWNAMAELRWQAGGRRSDALEAQRAAVAATRRWATWAPDAASPLLATHLRRLAHFAGRIGLRTEAEAALAESEALDRVAR